MRAIFAVLLMLASCQLYGLTSWPNIFMVAMPKSGSTYIETAIKKNQGYSSIYIKSKFDRNTQLYNIELAKFFEKQHSLAKMHFRAPVAVLNLNHPYPTIISMPELQKYTNKMVLHIRDPRQVLLSLVHYMNSFHEYFSDWFDLPSDYYNLTFEQQLDWGIDNILPFLVTWIEDWMQYIDQIDKHPNNRMQILVTTYDELLKDEYKLYQKILAFYDIKSDPKLYKPLVHNHKVRFRQGDPNEWRSVFSSTQQKKITAKVPQKLLARFNWQ